MLFVTIEMRHAPFYGWAWNNTLSVCQQALIMNKHGAKMELWDNIRRLFKKDDDKA